MKDAEKTREQPISELAELRESESRYRGSEIFLSFLIGSVLLAALSFIQKIMAGFNPFTFKEYLVPFLFGGVSGAILGIYIFKVKALSRKLLQRVQEANTRLGLATRASGIGAWDWDLRTNRVHFSPEWKRQIGYKEEEITDSYEEWESRLHPEDRVRILAALQENLDGAASDYDVEFRLRHKDGSYRWIATRGQVLLDDRQQPYRMLGCHLDVTERKRMEEELRESKARAEEYLNIAGVMLVVIDADETIALMNMKGCKSLGYDKGELIGRNWIDTLVPQRMKDEIRGVFRELMAGNMEPVEFYENPLLTKDGEERLIAFHNTAIRDPLGQIVGVLFSAEDITERKRMEEELLRTQRLRAVGELSAGISHNLNNVLTGVLGPAAMLKRMTNDADLLREVDEITTSGIRARDLVKRLGQAVRVGDEQVHPVAVNDVVTEALSASRPRWQDEAEAKGIAIEVVRALGDVPDVAATEAGLHDIVLNLIFNAMDAMPEGGVLTVSTQEVDGGVQVIVCDTGSGMDEATRNRVFEPFFTTKMDVGSGLGLATVHNSVIGWGGSIDVESAPGEGTTFRIELPVWAEAEGEKPEATTGPRQVRRAKLLIVEDDQAVSGLLSRLLRTSHEVEAVGNAGQALETIQQGRYDVALIDLGMPGFPGDQVAREMRQLDPSVATVLITGWDLPEDDGRRTVFDFHLRKPFDDLGKVEDVVAQAVELHDERAEKV